MPSYDDDDYDGRRGRQSRDDDYYDERDDYDDYAYRRDPRQRLQAPGRSLMIVGLIGVVLSLIIPLIVVIVQLNDQPMNANARDESTELMVFVAVCALLTAAYFGIIAYGGLKMMRGQSYGLAMTAAILTIVSIICIGVFSFLMLPFGIWAIVVLSDSRVKRVFNQSRRYSRPVEDDDDDDYR